MFAKYNNTKVWKRAVTLFVLMVVGIGGIGFGAHEALDNSNSALEASQIRCESGNELRKGLREEKETEIRFLENLPKLFPGAPEGTFKAYTDAEIKNIEHNKDTVFAPKDC